jgi:hypothetical protein
MPLSSECTTPLVTLTLFGYETNASRAWAFGQMAFARRLLARQNGLRFWKMMGSGQGGGFSIKPDWSRYGLFAVWKSKEAADNFFDESQFIRRFQTQAAEIWTIRLLPIKAHGKWSGENLFDEFVTPKQNSPIAILTRASIHLNKLKRFWSHVPATSGELEKADGLIASIGVGEAPFVHQATFSLWQSEREMQDFAYRSPIHREVIRKTRAENWYREELFARFVPVAAVGKWNGRNPLEGLL